MTTSPHARSIGTEPIKALFYIKAASLDGQKLVITTSKRPTTSIPRPFTRTRQKGYFPIIRCWRKRQAESMSVPMQNRSKMLPKTMIIIIMTKKSVL